MAANIVLILIDDLGWMDLSCYGSTFYETPRIDRLAAEGLRFTNAYAACPVCSPTRAALLSGKYPARVGITNWIGADDCGKLASVPYLHYLPRSEVSVASALREQGYQTWHVGKWHLGDRDFFPDQHGFDVNLGGCHWGMPKRGYSAPWGIETLDEDGVEPGTYLTDHLTDRAIGLLEDRDRDRPFFLHLSHYAVHTPIEAPAELVARYQDKARALRLDQVPATVIGEPYPCLHKRDQRVERRVLQSDPTYAAMVANLDWNIGRFLDALDAAGLAEDTLVLFTSDNGGLATAEGAPTCNLPLAEGKGWSHEGGTRVCQIARWPGHIQPGSVTRTPVTSTDVYPTFLAAAGAPSRPEQHVDGVDLLPLFARPDQLLDREALFWHYPHYGNQGCTPFCSLVSGCGRWKLVEYFETGAVQLFDLVADPSECHDRARDEPERTADLHRLLRAWRDEVEALVPGPNPDWRPLVADNARE